MTGIGMLMVDYCVYLILESCNSQHCEQFNSPQSVTVVRLTVLHLEDAELLYNGKFRFLYHGPSTSCVQYMNEEIKSIMRKGHVFEYGNQYAGSTGIAFQKPTGGKGDDDSRRRQRAGATTTRAMAGATATATAAAAAAGLRGALTM
eukprot:1221404-Pleurochrysis_carterae.AAC.2